LEKEAPYTNNLFSNHFLEERLENLDEWEQVEIKEEFEKIRALWDKKKRYLKNNPNEDNTQEEWINKILAIIGHQQWGSEPTKTIGKGRNLNPDYLFFKDFETKLDAEESDNQFEEGYLIGEAKKYGRVLDKSMDNHENPSFQIFNYVDRLRTPWGLLTNGKKWRLYSYEDCEADTFYEIDIVEEILEKDRETALQNFKYFYLFFRQESFLPKENSFLNKVYEGSENYAKGIEEDLEDAIYTALEETARGFFETNDIEMTEENIEEVHHSSLILLYRFLFILNAESRELLPVKEDRYESILSIEFLKEQLLEDKENVFTEDTWLWEERIEKLFESINEGREYGDFKITAYNGGLFDEEKHPFLAQNQLQGNHVRRILELLAESEDEETGEKVLVDYRDLNIRHLGSIYEGLLEHELREAEENLILENGEWKSASKSKKDFENLPREQKVEQGEVYLTNESGERKATGSYYTPEYIVEYIVENTIGPKVEEKIEESSQEKLLDNVLELNVCDPAMGSGHFLTEATSFIARRVLEHGKIEEEKVEGENEFIWVKRQVVSHCIYGVDINPLAVELGKLSLWIETMAEGKPLNFLDHHLKTGNSLVGSDFEEIFSHPTEKQKRMDSDRWRHIESPEKLKKLFREKYKRIEEQEEETKEDVHEKEDKYKEFLDSTIYRQIKQLANIHTRQYFEEEANSSDYEDFIVNIGLEDNAMETMEWFKSAQQDAETKNYFHWQIEFPEVFFGQKQGFDAIVGNPPYVKVQNMPHDIIDYIKTNYEVAYRRVDISIAFIQKATQISNLNGLSGYITSLQFRNATYGENVRKYLSKRDIRQIVNFQDLPVFGDATTYPGILIWNRQDEDSKLVDYYEVQNLSQKTKKSFLSDKESSTIRDYETYIEEGSNWDFISKSERELMKKLEENISLSGKAESLYGIISGADDILLFEPDEAKNSEIENEIFFDVIRGTDPERWYLDSPSKKIIYPYKSVDGEMKLIPLEELKTEYPKTFNYLSNNKEKLISRQDSRDSLSEEDWYKLMRPGRLDHYRKNKIVTPGESKKNKFSIDNGGSGYSGARVFGLITENIDIYGLLGILNSNLCQFYLHNTCPIKRGGYYSYSCDYLDDIPIIEPSKDLIKKAEIQEDQVKKRKRINLNISDYLGNYSEGDTLDELYTPASGLSDTPLTDTASDREKLQVGSVDTQRNGDSVTLLASARYKPEDESGHDTDQYGYTETEMFSAMEFYDLSETEKALIKEFVPVAVDEAGGFADFRKKATKTNSLIDRLKKLTLPKVSDVEDDLKKFVEQKKKAEKLEEKIEKTDQQINEIVYELYDLTEEEIEIVEDSVE